MKKTYMAPVVTTARVSMEQHLLAGSIETSGNPASVDEETGDYNTLSRRGSSLWDDDDE